VAEHSRLVDEAAARAAEEARFGAEGAVQKAGVTVGDTTYAGVSGQDAQESKQDQEPQKSLKGWASFS